jgi:phage/plasmid-associated DNA primase
LAVQYYFEQHDPSGGPSPHITKLRNCRAVFSEEAKYGAQFNDGRFKAITANTIINSRKLYANDLVKFMANFKVIISMNDLCNFGTNPAVWDRMVHVEHTSRFDSNLAPDDEEEQYKTHIFKENKRFNEKFPILGSAYMWFLIQNYYKYKEEGLCIPQSVINSTTRHRQRNDPFFQFAKHIKKSSEPLPIPTPLEKLFEAFNNKVLSGRYVEAKRGMNILEFQEKISNYIGEPDNEDPTYWSYYYLQDIVQDNISQINI